MLAKMIDAGRASTGDAGVERTPAARDHACCAVRHARAFRRFFRLGHGAWRAVLSPAAVLSTIPLLAVGCRNSFCCPDPTPLMKPARRADLAGTWQASFLYNRLTPWASAANQDSVGDTFLQFDESGTLQFVGLLTPGGQVGLWQVDFQGRRFSPLFRVVRGGIALDNATNISSSIADPAEGHEPETADVVGVRVDYSLRADDGFGVVGFDLSWTLEDIRISPDRTTLSAVLTQTERTLNSPVSATSRFGGLIELRNVRIAVQDPTGRISPKYRLVPRDGGQPPYAAGTVFDVDATATTGPSGLTYHWSVYRVTVDVLDHYLSASALEVPDGPTSSFKAGIAGTYFVRCWVTDGVQWATGFPLAARVE